MSLSMRKRAVLVSLETTNYGALTAPSTVLQVSNLNFSPLEGSEVKRDFIRSSYGDAGSVRVENYVKMDFETELAGSGTGGTAASWGVLMKASNFKETVSAAVASEAIGAVVSAPALVVTLDTNAAATLNLYNSASLTVSNWTVSETRKITAYSTARVATVDVPFSNAFAAGAVYSISGTNTTAAVSGITTTAILVANQLKLGVTASVTDGSYIGATLTLTDVGGANPEVFEIIGYVGATKMASLSRPITITRLITALYSIGASVSYTPVSSVTFESAAASGGLSKSASFYFVVDGVKHSLRGARGTVSFDVSAKKIPVAKWSFTGLFDAIVDDVTAVGLPTGWQIPVTVSTANTKVFSLVGVVAATVSTGVATAIESLMIGVGNEVKYRQLIGQEVVLITNRAAKATAQFEADALRQKDWFDAAKNAFKGLLTVTHGVLAGNTITFVMPAAQIANPKYSDGDGIAMISMDLPLTSIIGNDELYITTK